MAPLAGKPRSFGRGVGLSIVTLGLYGLYWNYKARKEIYDQEKQGDFPVLFYALGFIPLLGIVFIVMYVLKTQEFIQKARQGRGLSAGVGGWEVILWFLLPIAGAFVSYYKEQTTMNEYWEVAAKKTLTTFSPAAPPQKPAA